jgi:signal transduction histidine kinase
MRELAPDHEPFWFQTYGKVALTGESLRFVSEAKALHDRWYDVYAFRIGQPKERSVGILFNDITERINAEETLRRAKERLVDHAGELEQAVSERTTELTSTNKNLEAFVYSIAHDLRAPLRAMEGFSEMLVEEAGSALSEAGQDFARRIRDSAQFMDALLVDLLTFSRISKQRIQMAPVDPETAIKAELSRLEGEIQKKQARVEVKGPWPLVFAHESTLNQVLFNLLSNALKFTRPNVKPLLRLRAEEVQGDVAQLVRIWVEDNGIGIAPEHQEQTFRLFTRLQGDKFPGTGLGLAIVEKGVEHMGGRVGVESTLGKGSQFWIELRKA